MSGATEAGTIHAFPSRMLHSLNEIKGFKINAIDGIVGKCRDFLFDDQNWILRYVVVDTGGWLTGRKVVVSPSAFHAPDWDSKTFPVHMDRKFIEDSPPIEEHAPVSRRREMELAQYYTWPNYWAGMSYASTGVFPPQPLSAESRPSETHRDKLEAYAHTLDEDRHLRSVSEVEGYGIHATVERIGHVADFIVDDTNWSIRYLVVDTRHWLPGRRVLLSPRWASAVRWSERLVHVKVPRDQIREAPEFTGVDDLTPEMETRLRHYWSLSAEQ
jgi:hypothetical protein